MSRRPANRTTTRRGAAPRKKPARGRRKNRPSMIDQAIAALPVSQATLQKLATWSIVGATAAAALAVAAWFGVPGIVGTGVAEVIGSTGLRAEQIVIHGHKRMDRNTIYAAAQDQLTKPMPLVDLNAVRERLLAYGWIEDAQVSRRLPDTLLIQIVEREPAAIWQNHGQLMLIDAKGVLLAPVSPDAMPALPLVIGDGANEQEPAYRKLLEAAPALKPLVKAATWVGNRRWDIIFDTGEKLQLPEGDDSAAAALRVFAEKDGTQRLLGRGFVLFDMRDPEKLVLRRQASAPTTQSAAPAALVIPAPEASPSPQPSENAEPKGEGA